MYRDPHPPHHVKVILHTSRPGEGIIHPPPLAAAAAVDVGYVAYKHVGKSACETSDGRPVASTGTACIMHGPWAYAVPRYAVIRRQNNTYLPLIHRTVIINGRRREGRKEGAKRMRESFADDARLSSRHAPLLRNL